MTDIIVVPDGTERIAPMVLDRNLYRWMEKKEPDCLNEFSLCQYSHIGKLVIPQSVTVIEPFAFCLQKGLGKITMHDGITSIFDAAFMACSALEEVVIDG